MSEFKRFFCSVICNRAYYLLVLLFCIVAYSFSLYNRTISWDDLMREHYLVSGNVMLSGRWGMVVWARLLAMVDLIAFVDRFVSLCFYIINVLLLSYLIYVIDKKIRILPLALFSSIFLTFPLINEIFEYGVANFALTGGMCLSTLAAIVIMSNVERQKKVLYASLLLILPISSYESPVFYYIALSFILLFLGYYKNENNTSKICFGRLVGQMMLFITPLFFAFLIRVLVSLAIRSLYNLDYIAGGDAAIHWFENNNILELLRFVIGMTFIKYILAALIYFPIRVFLGALLIFVIIISTFNRKQPLFVLLGVAVIISIFAQSVIQGGYMPYRTAQTIPLFVAFVAFMVCEKATNWKLWKRNVAIVCLFGLCWHQAVYLNNLLSLNNLRSDNEMTILRDMGRRMVSDYDKKPVVFVSSYSLGPWINERVKINRDTWNGKLYADVVEKFVSQDMIRHYHLIDKIVETNVSCTTEQYAALKNYFAYCGFDIDVVGPIEKPHTSEYLHKDLRLLREATKMAKAEGMRPYQIKDAGDYLIVTLSNELYYLDMFEQ